MANCPECKRPVGGDTGTDPYKHLIQCLHLPNQGIDQLLAQYEGKEDERSRRVLEGLKLAQEER